MTPDKAHSRPVSAPESVPGTPGHPDPATASQARRNRYAEAIGYAIEVHANLADACSGIADAELADAHAVTSRTLAGTRVEIGRLKANDLTAELADLKAEVERLRGELADPGESPHLAAKYWRDRQRLRVNVDRLRSSVALRDDEIDRLKNRVDDLRAQEAELRTEATDAKSNEAAWRDGYLDACMFRDQARAERDTAKDLLRRADLRADTLKARIAEDAADRQFVEDEGAELAAVQTQRDEARDLLDRAQATAADALVRETDWRGAHHELSGFLAIAEEERDEARATIDRVKALVPEHRMWLLVEALDQRIDDGAGPAYHEQPLAQDWARVAKIQEEAGEAIDALIGVTAQNHRKGQYGSMDDLFAELADVALTGVYAIQHFTKDIDRTRTIFLARAERHAERVGITLDAPTEPAPDLEVSADAPTRNPEFPDPDPPPAGFGRWLNPTNVVPHDPPAQRTLADEALASDRLAGAKARLDKAKRCQP